MVNQQQAFPIGSTDEAGAFVLTRRLSGSPPFGQFVAQDKDGIDYLATTTLQQSETHSTLLTKLAFDIEGMARLVHIGRLYAREPTSYDMLVEAMPTGVPSHLARVYLSDPISVARLGIGLVAIVKTSHAAQQYLIALRPQTIYVAAEGKDISITGIAPRADRFYFSAAKPDVYTSLAFNDTFTAPEFWLGSDAGASADVFSICAILAFWLTGRTPFRGDSFQEQTKAIMRNDRAFRLRHFGVFGQLVESGLDFGIANRPSLTELSAVLRTVVGGSVDGK
jgi:hypothetical protein